ncbi:MAG: TolC family protein, partial [Arcobacter sp.]
MKIILCVISLTILFSGCVPKVTTSNTIKDSKIDDELIKDLNEFTSNNIELKKSWWKDFNDKQLNILIENAIKDAPSLKQLEAKYQKANNIIKAKKSANLPNVNFESQATRQRFSENYIFPEPLGGNYYNLY